MLWLHPMVSGNVSVHASTTKVSCAARSFGTQSYLPLPKTHRHMCNPLQTVSTVVVLQVALADCL